MLMTLVTGSTIIYPLAMAGTLQTATPSSRSTPIDCPMNRVCSGDITLFSWDRKIWGKDCYKGAEFYVSTKPDPAFPQDYKLVSKGGKDFHGLWYHTLPYAKYNLVLVTIACNVHIPSGKERVPEAFKYRSKAYDSLDKTAASDNTHENVLITPHDGIIATAQARSMGLPAIPICTAGNSGHICSNQIVHLFWSNERPAIHSPSTDSTHKYIVLRANLRHRWPSSIRCPRCDATFNNYFYTIPTSKYNNPISFKVHWMVHDVSQPITQQDIQVSSPLVRTYYPEYASWCTRWDKEFTWCQ